MSGAARQEREWLEGVGADELSLACTHCDGDGTCEDGADPLDRCPDEAHPCHACNGSGRREDQVIF